MTASASRLNFSKLDTQPTYTPVYASLSTSQHPTQNSGPSGLLIFSRKALLFFTSHRFFPALHLLAFGEPLTDDLIHRRLHKAGRDRFLIPPPFAVVGNQRAVGGDIRVEFVKGFCQLPPVVTGDSLAIEIAEQIFDLLPRAHYIPVPQKMFCAFQNLHHPVAFFRCS